MNTKKKQFCKHGHDTFLNGRIKNGRCRICSCQDHKKLYINLTDEQYEKECIRKREYARQHYVEINKKRYLENREAKIAAASKWQADHKQERLEYMRNYNKNREQNDPCFKLSKRLRHRVRQAIKNNQKSGSAIKDLGCSVEFLTQYIADRFAKDMTWSNWGYGNDKWNIDHIIPLSSFDLTDPIQFKRAVHYTNLQPLWQPDNFKKGGNNHVS